MMDILKMGAELLKEKLGTNADLGQISEALSGLLGGADGKVDLGALVAKMMEGGGLKDIVGSWLGDGENAGISANQMMDMLGGDKVAEFADKVGVQASTARDGLADVLPKLIDQASSGGSLLEAAGGLGGLLDKAKKLF